MGRSRPRVSARGLGVLSVSGGARGDCATESGTGGKFLRDPGMRPGGEARRIGYRFDRGGGGERVGRMAGLRVVLDGHTY